MAASITYLGDMLPRKPGGAVDSGQSGDEIACEIAPRYADEPVMPAVRRQWTEDISSVLGAHKKMPRREVPGQYSRTLVRENDVRQ
jgi:hypothetical protein